MRSNWQYALLALVLALLSWYLVSGRERVETWAELPVVITGSPEDLALVDRPPNRIEARISGPRGMIRNIDRATLTYALDLDGLEPGLNEIVFEAENVPLPGTIRVLELRPGRAVIRAEPVVTRTLPVAPRWRGNLAQGWRLASASSEPPVVVATGPNSTVMKMTSLPTALVDVASQRPEVVEQNVPVEVPDGVSVVPSKVRARLVFGPEMASFWIKEELEPPNGWAGRVRMTPAEVRLHVEIPQSLALDAGFRRQVRVRPKLPADASPGSYEVGYEVELPKHSSVLDFKPPQVVVQVESPGPKQ